MNRLTYLDTHLKKGKLLRWPSQCFPLPVFIAKCSWYSMSENDRYFYKDMAIRALKEWEKIGQGKFSFVLTDVLSDSQMNIEWRRVDRKSLGDCSFNFDNESRLYSAEVSIGISDGIIHKKYMDENEVYHTILHEIGHALGLGHSPNEGDIMYTPHQYGIINLSERDINSVRWLYTFPYGTTLESLNRTYSLDCTSIDDVIMKITRGEAASNFEKTLRSINKPSRNLEEEQRNLAEIKKFQMSLQNIRLPKEITDKFKER
ncbi:MAG: matrixin family metalloprotease [Candidatus Avigastranaerophilus sp.]